MHSAITRRDFLKASAATVAATVASPLAAEITAAEPIQKKWYKGDLHQHSLWSDGDFFPGWIADWYKSNGYHFTCPSDHNVFQGEELRFQNGLGNPMPEVRNQEGFRRAFDGETSYWRAAGLEPKHWWEIPWNRIEEYRNIYGKDSLKTIEFEGVTYVRLDTFDELAAEKNEPGRFLMIPGFEQTKLWDGRTCHVHMNFINVRETFPIILPETAGGILEENFRKGEDVYEGQDYLITANHPLWPYYDFQPSDLIRLPQYTLYELTNNFFSPRDMHRFEEAWLPEKMWDIVNAYRAVHDQPLLYGMGSDDFHTMEQWGRGWSVVRAERLEIPDILAAIRAGDFYASRGLAFDDIRFDGKTLEVKIDVQEEGEYVIDFIGTKKDYSPECRYIETDYEPGKTLQRKLECYSDEIGKVLETVEGTEGSYTLKPEDLYVRAKIYKKGAVKKDWETENAAWTQPYRS